MKIFSNFLNQNRLTRFFKNKRNHLINSYFLSKKSHKLDLLLDGLSNQESVVFSIAFNKPICIRIMLDCWSKHVPKTKLVVIDNSNNPIAAEEIAQLCKSRCCYLRLPKNPEWSPNRSHALAMNWTYYNLVKMIEPKYFGYLDHDCFPFADFDLTARMQGSKIYGERRSSEKFPDIWSLWAGFCFFEYAHTKGKKINFTHSIELGLDTGGGNWPELYRDLPPDAYLFANSFRKNLLNKMGHSKNFTIIMESFIHFGSASRSDKGNPVDMEHWDVISTQLKKLFSSS